MKKRVDLIIRQGLVFDGSGRGPVVADISVRDERIVAIGSFSESDAETVIPADGLIVAPGFIDSHSHSDFTLIADNRAEGKLYQGITTEINGNCGMSGAPLYGKAVQRREDDLKELGITERWNSAGEYFELLMKKGPALNTAMLVGHGNIRGSVMGYDNRQPSQPELSAMKQLLQTSIEEGGIGLSTGLIYPPGIYSSTEELIGLAEVLKPNDLIYTSHMRSEGSLLLESIEEVITISRRAGVRAHISHLKTAGQDNWHKAEEAIALIMDARQEGLAISCDRYPYIASSTDLDSILPSWAFEGGNQEELLRLGSPGIRAEMRQALLKQAKTRAYWQQVIISTVASSGNSWMVGKTMAQISEHLGCDEINALFRILLEERLRVSAIFLSMNEDNLREFLSLPFCAIGSDSSARCFDGPTRLGKPHPRTFGTFPRFFGRYVRDAKLMSMAEAVRRATMLPASLFGLACRGQIREGFWADMVIFDPDAISDRATFEEPFLRPAGIAYVLVNGAPAVWEGEITKNRSGRVLRR